MMENKTNERRCPICGAVITLASHKFCTINGMQVPCCPDCVGEYLFCDDCGDITPKEAITNLPDGSRVCEACRDKREDVTGCTLSELEAKCHELRELQRLIEEAQAEAETIKDEIKAHMGAREELFAGEYKITWKHVTSARLDGKALKAALPEVAERFTRETTTRRFSVA